MEGNKYMILKFESKEDFRLCNELMKANISNVGISVDGFFVVTIDTGSILVPHGILTVKTARGRDINIRVTSGTAKKVAEVKFDNKGNIVDNN